MTLREGSIVRVDVGRKSGRPGVVVLIAPNGRATVLWGTGTLRSHLRHVAVVPREPAGVALGLIKPTYFYASNAWDGPLERLDEQPDTCPRYLLAALRALVE